MSWRFAYCEVTKFIQYYESTFKRGEFKFPIICESRNSTRIHKRIDDESRGPMSWLLRHTFTMSSLISCNLHQLASRVSHSCYPLSKTFHRLVCLACVVSDYLFLCICGYIWLLHISLDTAPNPGVREWTCTTIVWHVFKNFNVLNALSG